MDDAEYDKIIKSIEDYRGNGDVYAATVGQLSEEKRAAFDDKYEQREDEARKKGEQQSPPSTTAYISAVEELVGGSGGITTEKMWKLKELSGEASLDVYRPTMDPISLGTDGNVVLFLQPRGPGFTIARSAKLNTLALHPMVVEVKDGLTSQATTAGTTAGATASLIRFGLHLGVVQQGRPAGDGTFDLESLLATPLHVFLNVQDGGSLWLVLDANFVDGQGTPITVQDSGDDNMWQLSGLVRGSRPDFNVIQIASPDMVRKGTAFGGRQALFTTQALGTARKLAGLRVDFAERGVVEAALARPKGGGTAAAAGGAGSSSAQQPHAAPAA